VYRSILVPIDVEQPSSWEKSVPTAVALCRCFSASLALTAVVPNQQLMIEAEWSAVAFRQLIDIAKARLAEIADGITEVPNVARYVEAGGIYTNILNVAERVSADLIVLSSHRPEMEDYLLGTNASRVVRHARCSVFVVRGEN